MAKMLSAILKLDTSLSWDKSVQESVKEATAETPAVTEVSLGMTVGLCCMRGSQTRGHLINSPKPPQDPEALRSPSGKEEALTGAIARVLPFKWFQGAQATIRAANRVWHMRSVWDSSLQRCSCRQVTKLLQHRT